MSSDLEFLTFHSFFSFKNYSSQKFFETIKANIVRATLDVALQLSLYLWILKFTLF